MVLEVDWPNIALQFHCAMKLQCDLLNSLLPGQSKSLAPQVGAL